VHRPQDARHRSPLTEYFNKSLMHMGIAQEIAIHQRQVFSNELRQVWVQLESSLLGVKEDAHQPARFIAKDIPEEA